MARSSAGFIADLNKVEARPAPAGRQGQQLQELEKLVETLEGGSVSLNQRATTLAALAVAALGAFGFFAARIRFVETEELKIIAAGLLGIASLALLATASFALWSVRPTDKWGANFAGRAKTAMEGQMGFQPRCSHLVETIKLQFERNDEKAERMKRAYDCSAIALFAGTLSVIMVLGDALFA